MQNDKPPIVLTKSGHSGVQTSCSNTPQSANNVPESAETMGPCFMNCLKDVNVIIFII